MLRFIKFFQGYLYVVIRGYSPERFLNLCSNHNIVIWELTPVQEGYSFCISLKAFRQLKPLLRKTGTRIRIQKRHGLPFLLFRYRKHRFFLFGIGCAFAILVMMSQFIWKVEITGNSYYSSQVLTEFLEESGVGYGVAKRKVDCAQIQTMLRHRFDDITWVSARISGTRLYLVVQERVGGTADTAVRSETPANLIAEYKGTVVSIAVRNGTPFVEKGDQVKKGDMLVSGQVDIMNDSGEVAKSNFCHADADVFIQTKLSYKNKFPVSYEKTEETGKKRYLFSLICGKYCLSAGMFPAGDENWDHMTTLYPVKAGEDFYLPFQVAFTRSDACETVRYTYTKEEIEEKAKKEFDRYCKKLQENGIQILSNSVIIDKNTTEVSVKGKLDVVIKADKFSEIHPEEIQEGTDADGIDTADDGHSD